MPLTVGQWFYRWIFVALRVKYWVGAVLASTLLGAVGLALLISEAAGRDYPHWVGVVTVEAVPAWLRGTVLLLLAGLAGIWSAWNLGRRLVRLVTPVEPERPLVSRMYSTLTARRGPKIVAIGGGTGLSTLLRGLKRYSANITAIVTVADDGGSSGRLRRDLDVIPPGDIRNCMIALSEAEPLLTRLFQYRFDEQTSEDLGGHAFGNLFIAAMAGVTGNFEEAVRETSRVLAVNGQILPSTFSKVTLAAQLKGGTLVRGESAIPAAEGLIERVFLEPGGLTGNPEAVRALMEADVVVVGPGSLYTSVLPNLLISDIGGALLRSPAVKVFVVNVATQHGETDGLDAAEHYRAICRHLGEEFADVILANSDLPQGPLPSAWHAEPVVARDGEDYGAAALILANIVDPGNRYRHDSERLASQVLAIYQRRAEHARWGTASHARATPGGVPVSR